MDRTPSETHDDGPLPPATAAVAVALLTLVVLGGALLLGLADAPALAVLGGWIVLVGLLLTAAVVLMGRGQRRPGRRSPELVAIAAAVASVGVPLIGWGVLLLDGGWRTATGVLLIAVGVGVVLVVTAAIALPDHLARPGRRIVVDPFWPVAPPRPGTGPDAYPVAVDGDVPDDPLARIRHACLALGLHEGSEFSVEGFPTALSSEHVDLRRSGRWYEVVYSDMGRDRVIARLATPQDAHDVFLTEVADLATGRRHELLRSIPRIRVPRGEDDESDDERVERFLRESRDRWRREEDHDVELLPDGWADMRALSTAVVAYLGVGTRAWPGTDREAALAELAGAGLPSAALRAVEELVAQACTPPVDWAAVPDHSRWVRDLMRVRHGGLTGEALDALAWNATFQWR
ncbi:hypothetical protein [Cellulomonas triticagri]|uniref:Uncharacterized protein n=1 Tax=Cellulomonas triticagri TaxID=2483352 RepID=A0A3M2ITK7_9CELL|nr:hypothetical protein [Cellulomonas triticagri]RMI03714.1 hypothetical protein EBM89_18610 [Cellulomonas triticagri]